MRVLLARTRNDVLTRGSLSVTPPLGATLLRVAWLAILLGLAMEGLLVLLGTGFGDLLGLKPIVAGFVKNVSWSVFVCVGLALGTTLSKIRLPEMGLLGFFAAPLAFEVSRVLHKGTLQPSRPPVAVAMISPHCWSPSLRGSSMGASGWRLPGLGGVRGEELLLT